MNIQNIVDKIKADDTTELELCYLCLTDTDVHEIIEALKENTRLKKLGLASNQITNVGAREFANFLPTHPTITHVDLTDNPINFVGHMELLQVQLLRKDSAAPLTLELNDDLYQQPVITFVYLTGISMQGLSFSDTSYEDHEQYKHKKFLP
jgi:hypothetical protein